MRTIAILPVKHFGAAKQRLNAALARGSRQALAQAMFSDVLSALRRARTLDAVAVVTADSSAEATARADRVHVVRDPGEAGQSAAAAAGIEYALDAGFDRVALVPGDTPMLDPEELDDLLERSGEDRLAAAIVPDRHGVGTNALVLSPPDAIVPRFGHRSLARHVAAAKAAGLAHRVEEVPSLVHDVDTPEDLAALAAALERRRGVAPLTRGTLRQLDRSGWPRPTTASAAASEALEV